MKKKVLGACAATVGVLLLIAAAVAVWILQKPETRFLVTMQQALREKGLLGEFWERREQGQLAQLDGRYRISLPLLGKKNMEFTAQFSDGTVLFQPTANSEVLYKYVYQDADNQQALQKLLGKEAETQIDFWLSVIEGTENGSSAGNGTGALGKERQKQLASYRKEGYLIILYAAVAKVILTKVVNRYAGDFINLPGNVTYTYSRIGVKIW